MLQILQCHPISARLKFVNNSCGSCLKEKEVICCLIVKHVKQKSDVPFRRHLSGQIDYPLDSRELRGMIRKAGPEALLNILKILRDGETPPSLRLSAAVFIVEHNLGRPFQAIALEADIRQALLVEIRRVGELRPPSQVVQVTGVAQDIVCDTKAEMVKEEVRESQVLAESVDGLDEIMLDPMGDPDITGVLPQEERNRAPTSHKRREE